MRKILSTIYGADPRMQKTRKRFSMGSVASFVAGVAQVDVGATLPDGTTVYMAIPAAQGLSPSIGGVAAIQYANENLHGGYITAIGQSVGVQPVSDADTVDGKHATAFVWVDLVTAKGDIIAATAANAVDNLAAGTNGKVLTAASGEATGLKWEDPATHDADTVDGQHASAFGLAVVTKTDTGDPAGSEGLLCINTFDNTFKVYAAGAWRPLATW